MWPWAIKEPSIDFQLSRYSSRKTGRTSAAINPNKTTESSHQLHRSGRSLLINEPRIPVDQQIRALLRQTPSLFASILRIVAILRQEIQQLVVPLKLRDQRREKLRQVESRSIHHLPDFIRRILPHVADLGLPLNRGPVVLKINLRIILPAQRLRDARNAPHIGRRHQEKSSIHQYAPRLDQHMHRIVNQMLDNLA